MDREKILERIEELENDNCISQDAFNEYLDEIFDGWKIVNLYYRASELLKSVDPIAYRGFYLDWSDSEIAELRDQLLHLPDETDGEE